MLDGPRRSFPNPNCGVAYTAEELHFSFGWVIRIDMLSFLPLLDGFDDGTVLPSQQRS
jgi:hypothetical protein